MLSFLLLPGSETFVLLITFVLLQTKLRKKALIALQVALFVIIFNAFLKSLWQIPLPETANSDGWAYPSGHLHFAVAYWSVLSLLSRSYFQSSITAICLGLYAYALVAKGYHYPSDLLPAAILGISEAILALYFFYRYENHVLSAIIALLAMILLVNVPRSYPELWIAMGGLLALPFVFYYRQEATSFNIESLMHSLTALILCLGLVQVLHVHTYELSPLLLLPFSALTVMVCFSWLQNITTPVLSEIE